MTQNPQPKTTKRDLNSRYLNSLLRNVRLKRFYGTEQGDHSCKQAYTEQEVPPKPALQNQGTPNNKNCFAGRVFFLLGGGGASFIIRGRGLILTHTHMEPDRGVLSKENGLPGSLPGSMLIGWWEGNSPGALSWDSSYLSACHYI